MITVSPIAPHSCRRCGAIVRTVEYELGGLLTIDNEPSPDGDLIPWPAKTPAGVAQARRISVPISDGPMWREHQCLYT